MAVIGGHGGDVALNDGTNDIALQVMEWSLDIEDELIETTNQGSAGNREYILGVEGWSGSFKAHWDTTINGGAPPHNLVKPQTSSITLDVGDNDGTAGTGVGGTYTGSVVLTKLSITDAFEGAIEYTGEFTGTGAITYAP